MKFHKFILMILAITLFSFSGCSSDSDLPEPSVTDPNTSQDPNTEQEETNNSSDEEIKNDETNEEANKEENNEENTNGFLRTFCGRERTRKWCM